MRRIALFATLVALAWSTPALAGDADCPCKQAVKDIKKGVSLEQGQLSVGFHSRMQVWGGWVGEDALLTEGDMMQEAGFRLRRARFGVSGQLLKTVTFDLELNIFDQERSGGPLHTAAMDWTPTPFFGVTLGVDKFLFSRGAIMSSRKLSHLDRAMVVYGMAPPETMGMILHSEPWKDHLKIQLAVTNGLQRKPGFHQGFEGVGVTLGNRFERQAFAGRVDLEPLDKVGCGEPDLHKTGSLRLGLGGGGYYNHGKSIATHGYSGYLHLKAWGFHLFGEALFEHGEPQEKPTSTNIIQAEIDRMAFYGTVGYMVLADRLGVSFRTEFLDDNKELDDEGDQLVLTGTLTWYQLGHYLKAQIEYQHRQELNGATIDNDAVIAGVLLSF